MGGVTKKNWTGSKKKNKPDIKIELQHVHVQYVNMQNSLTGFFNVLKADTVCNATV